jgi:hypothetical protein
MALRLIDAIYPQRVVSLNLQVVHGAGLAYDFSQGGGWSREEIGIFIAAVDPLAPQPLPSQEAAVVAVAEKIDALMSHAEAVWEQDEREMRLLVAGPDLGGGK